MKRVACIGECMLELSGGDASGMTLSYGGDTLNTAIYLARLGVPVDYVTALGDDPYSDGMIEQWRAEGVGTDLIVRVAGRLPGLYAIRTDDRGERQFFYWRDQAPARDLFTLPESATVTERLVDYDWIHLTGVTLSLYSAEQRARLYRLLDGAREKGGKVAFDSNYRPRGWDGSKEARSVMTELLGRADLALPTLDDDRQIYSDENADACADRLYRAGIEEVVVKMDAQGCLVSGNGRRELIPTVAQENPVDTTGAGDSFNAGYLAARLSGKPPREAAREAHRIAGEVIMHPGAIMPREAMPEENT